MGGHDHCCATGCTSCRGDVEDRVRLSFHKFPKSIN